EDAPGQLWTLHAAGAEASKINAAFFHLSGKAAFLRLALVRQIQSTKDLQDVDNRLAYGPLERVAGLNQPVDAETNIHLLALRFEVKIRGPKSDGLVHQGGSGLIPFGVDRTLDPSWNIFGRGVAPADKLTGRTLVSFRSPFRLL